ncbi:MAG TPA: glycosyltransferase, partial [Sphingomicrobium sp.]|nr:glycosyltransferase [Sphingomicrobium sp.]
MDIADRSPPNAAPAKRALFVVITDYPGGAERVTFLLAAELAARPGWQVEVKIVCSQLPDSFSRQMLPAGVRVSYGLAHNWFLAFPLLPFRLLFRRYDLVFTTHVYTNAMLSLLRRSGLIQARRLVLRESMSLFDRFKGAKARRFPWLYRAYGGEDLVIAQTGYMADHVRPWLPPHSRNHLHSLANPANVKVIETAAADPVEPALLERLEGRCNILFCGRLVDFKRPGAALEAFRIAMANDSAAQLVFLGNGALEAQVRRQAAEAGLVDRVLFLGFRSNPYPVMAACQYGLVTSANEGFPNVVIEMMACGMRKIIATPCAGDLDQLPGITVTHTFGEQEIARALRTAREDGENCAEVYKRFAATRSVSTYLDAVLRLP